MKDKDAKDRVLKVQLKVPNSVLNGIWRKK